MEEPREKNPNAISDQLLDMAYQIIEQTHYEGLDSYPLQPLSQDIEDVRPEDILCLFRVKELVFNKEKGNLQAFRIVLNALHACDAACVMLLVCREGRTELYIGAANKSRPDNLYYLNTIREILSTGLRGNLPGSDIEEILNKQEINDKLEESLADGFDAQSISSVSCVASPLKKDDPIIGLEKLVDAVGDRNFSLLVLADPVDSPHIQQIRSGYESLATELSEYESWNQSVQTGKNVTISTSESRSYSTSISNSISSTQSHNVTNGWNEGKSRPDHSREAMKRKALGAGSAMAMSAMKLANPSAGYAVMSIASSIMNAGTVSDGRNYSESHGTNKTIGTNQQQGQNDQVGVSRAEGMNYGITVSTSRKDRQIQGLMAQIDSYLKWLNRCESYGMFNCCAYVISGSASTNLLVASQYQALMQGEEEISHMAAINTWSKGNGIETTRHALMHLMHPVVIREKTAFSPAMLISSKELARQMALPQNSIVGVSVMEYAPFGRDVTRKSLIGKEKMLRIGSIYHMGATMERQPVLLDMQSLASHTFIAGTNGSGKSNTIFRLLEELNRNGIPFMVIEPAKGEYKNVFGLEDGVAVYGTNKYKTPLLRLNPFWFNLDIDVKEHIARVMDVFKASWPMYAAMPSILNTAIENAYRACGWNLDTSRCMGERVFPTIVDVQNELGRKMDSTAFSDEVRGNYTGALTTRMEALTTGLFGDIFSGADLGDAALFDSNVIIDLSRAGSPEVSAMIMGMLLIRLREYRMSEGALNHPLRHVTVLEEAHNLLRKTSGEQSEDSSNLMGKAVEMISNAIAEMRSYGDGFIIADQSPGLLDTSVLRNTNTKLILRLPESGDREMVAGTIGLNKKQTLELSHLKTGVSAVYQKDWQEPVLCKVDRAIHEEHLYTYKVTEDETERNKKCLVGLLLDCGDESPATDVNALILGCAASGADKRQLLQFMSKRRTSWKARALIAARLYPITMELPISLNEGFDRWIENVYDVNQLPRTLLSRCVIAANAWKHSDQNRRWADIARLFYNFDGEQENLKKARGFACRLLLVGESELSLKAQEDEIRDTIETLETGEATDLTLVELLRNYLVRREPRKRGELFPYEDIAWDYVGQDNAWSEVYPLLLSGDCEGWDMRMGQALQANVECDMRTEGELLELCLQYNRDHREVREFYYLWISWRKTLYDSLH